MPLIFAIHRLNSNRIRDDCSWYNLCQSLSKIGHLGATMRNSRLRKIRFNRIVCRKRMKRRKRSQVKKRIILEQALFLQEFHRDPDSNLALRHLRAPTMFSICHRNPRSEVLSFLAELKRIVLIERRRVYIDFSNTRKMVADGTLLLFAELDSIARRVFPKKMIIGSCPTDKIVAQVLKHIGVMDILGNRKDIKIDHETVKYWHSSTGTEVDGIKAKPIAEFYNDKVLKNSTTGGLYNGLVEAMTNSCHHAYPDIHNGVGTSHYGERRWWMFSQERQGILSVVFCDLGIGIPCSLRSGNTWSLLTVKDLLLKFKLPESDGALIRTAFELGKSRTEESNRGFGLSRDIKNVLDLKGDGNLMVLSGTGLYKILPNGDNSTIDFPGPISGTMISWSFGIKDENE